MARIHSKDTKPELAVRKYLYSRGYRYRKNDKRLPGTPDIVMRKYGVVIFIHGCFWHGHSTHLRIPKSNIEFWENKIRRNQERDNENKEKLHNMGWCVITIWECQLKPKLRQSTLSQLEFFINNNYLRNHGDKHSYIVEEDKYLTAAEGEVDYK
jgi:DNA mismatch endonuclease (patch repair protein)